MKDLIKNSVLQSIDAITFLNQESSIDFIEQASEMIANSFRKNGKLLIAGNGGSLCDAMHFAEELTGFYREKRRPLPAIALADPGHMSCVSNDVGFDEVFSRPLLALGQPEDIFIFLTTSGNSSNIIKAFSVAEKLGIKTIGFLGKEGGKLKGKATLELVVSGFKFSDRIQEAHMAAIHIIIEMVEKKLFDSSCHITKPSLELASFG